jgi:four helix bundle protein
MRGTKKATKCGVAWIGAAGMVEHFGHERLKVYQKGMQFTCSSDLLSKLDKSTTSIVLNTVEGNGRFSGTDQAKFLGIAYRATVQSATLVDLTTADSCPADPSPVEEGRDLLRRIAAMLRQLSKAVRDDI